MFDDVPKVFDHWRMHLFIKLFTYASGSREGQKLFFKSSKFGDLTPFFNNYIDSSGGAKRDSQRYLTIAVLLREKIDNILFFTDEPEDAQAALDAGMK